MENYTLKWFRIRRAATLEEWADAIGETAETVKAWEEGRAKPETAAVERIAEAWGGLDPERLAAAIAADYDEELTRRRREAARKLCGEGEPPKLREFEAWRAEKEKQGYNRIEREGGANMKTQGNGLSRRQKPDEASRIMKAYRRADEGTKRVIAKLLDVQRDYKSGFKRIK